LISFGPDQGLGVWVPVFHEPSDGPLQLRHAVETVAPDRLLAGSSRTSAPADRANTGGSAVDMEARKRRQLLTHGRVIMAPVLLRTSPPSGTWERASELRNY
jgi:hypothetical protein